jgi:hypothetical protein
LGRTSASVLFDSGGFEPPAYSTTYNPGGPGPPGYDGQLEDQPLPDALFFHQAGPDTNTATVIPNTVGGTGAQVVELHRTSAPDTRWGVPTPVIPTSVNVSWDMRVEPSTVPPGDGPFFGVETYALPGGGFSVLGSLGVDASTGSVMIQAPGTGDLIPVSVVGLGVWNSFSLLLDYVTQTYTALVNSLPVAVSVPFVDGIFATYNDFDLSGLQSSATGAGSVGTAYYDNVSVTAEGVIPEPTALIVWGFGTLIAAGIWRSRS